MALQILDVVPHASHAKLTEMGEVLTNLRGVEMKLQRERLRRHGSDACRPERIQTAKVHGKPVRRELGDLFVELFALDRQFHKLSGRDCRSTLVAGLPRRVEANTRGNAPDHRVSALRPSLSIPAEFTPRAVILGAHFSA